MKKLSFILLTIILALSGCSKDSSTQNETTSDTIITQKPNTENNIEKSPSEIKNEIILEKINSMTLEEKVGQLFMCAFRQDENGNNITELNNEIIDTLNNKNIGGVVIFGENITSSTQLKNFLQDIKNTSKIPLFLGIDEEGGSVSRIKKCSDLSDYNIPSAQEMAQKGEEYVYEMNSKIGSKLFDIGFNVDFAPVADINTNPQNTVIGDRAYGSEPESAAKFVAQAVKALNDNNIQAAVKHFPGHGDTFTDSHFGEAIVEHSKERIMNTELIPFKEGINAGANFVMIGHIKTPNITNDNLPASLSKQIITDILRNELGYDSIVITDAMNMGAISEYYDIAEVSLTYLNAGGDIILMPSDLDKAYDSILQAVHNGDISEERIDLSLKRILNVKYDIALQTGYGKQWFGIE